MIFVQVWCGDATWMSSVSVPPATGFCRNTLPYLMEASSRLSISHFPLLSHDGSRVESLIALGVSQLGPNGAESVLPSPQLRYLLQCIECVEY